MELCGTKKKYFCSQFMWWSHYTVDVITPVNTVFNQIFKPKASSEKKKT
jgi:hypothetical protein